MTKYGIIGGSDCPGLENLSLTHQTAVSTPYGDPSSPLMYGVLNDIEVVYLSRRGAESSLVPHKVNYLANMWALRDAGVEAVIATSLMMGIADNMTLDTLVVPDQLIDYTYGRECTFALQEQNTEISVDFSKPYHEDLRQNLIKAASLLDTELVTKATCGVMQGPRTPTEAEVARYRQDGCDVLSMTAMPEASLAMELGMSYACLARIGPVLPPTANSLPTVISRILETTIQMS